MILTALLRTFLGNFTQGSQGLTTEALWLLSTLFSMELLLVGAWFAIRREFDWGIVLHKALMAGVLVWLMQHWSDLTKLLINSFIEAAILASGQTISVTDVTDPDNIAQVGITMTAGIFQHLSQYTGVNALYNIVEILFSGFTALLAIGLYFGMAVWIFLTLLEYYLATSVTVILLPWAMFSKTAWLTEKTIAYVGASAVRLLILTFILGSALPVLNTLVSQANTDFVAALRVFLGGLALLLLSVKANGIAQGLIHGSPSLFLYDATQLAQTVTRQVTQFSQVVQSLAQTIERALHGGSGPRPSPPSQRRL